MQTTTIGCWRAMLQLVPIGTRTMLGSNGRPLILRSTESVMSYEPGTTECRVLINSKEAIETMLLNLGRINGTEAILQQLRQVHQQLEVLHDERRTQVEAHQASAGS